MDGIGSEGAANSAAENNVENTADNTQQGNASNSNNENNQGNGDNADTKDSQKGNQENTVPNIEKLVQSAVDRATNKLGNENKMLKDQIEQLQNLNLSDAEKAEKELKKREQKLAEGEQALKNANNKMYAASAIRKAGLDDGGENVEGLVNLVLGDDENAINEKVSALSAYITAKVAAEVDKTFKENGRTPGKGNNDKNSKANDFVKTLGQKAAESAKQSKSIIDYYTGGKK